MSENTEWVEGIGLVDTDTGQILAAPADAPEAVRQGSVMTEQDAEWVLAKLFRLDSEIEAAQVRLNAELEAIRNNYGPVLNRLRRVRDSFARWMEPQLRSFAEAALERRNTKADGTPVASPLKTLRFPKGTLAFRTTTETNVYAPEGAAARREAVAWLERHCPMAVKYKGEPDLYGLDGDTEAVIIAVARGDATWEEVGWEGPCPLEVEFPNTEFKVKTGI